MKEDSIIIENVTKKFAHEIALNHVSLEVKRGTICGIIGRNGSGKTVLFKCICEFLNVTEGSISIFGKMVGKDKSATEKVGIIIEEPEFLNNRTGFYNLCFLAEMHKRIGKAEIEEVMEKVGLNPKEKKKVGKYSMGMRQRLGIAQAIMEEPDILILDEPMNGLDKHGVEDMRKLFLDLQDQGKTILFASHNKMDIDTLCDEVYEMDAGILQKIF